MGSGGGFRAACGLSGVMVALEESGIFNCSTYLTGLSGSSWYVDFTEQNTRACKRGRFACIWGWEMGWSSTREHVWLNHLGAGRNSLE